MKKETVEFLEIWNTLSDIDKRYKVYPEELQTENLEHMNAIMFDLAEHGKLTKEFFNFSCNLVGEVTGEHVALKPITKAKDISSALMKLTGRSKSRINLRGIYHCSKHNYLVASNGASLCLYPQKVEQSKLVFPKDIKSEGIKAGDEFSGGAGSEYMFPDYFRVIPEKSILDINPLNVDQIRRKLNVLSGIISMKKEYARKIKTEYLKDHMPVYGKAYIIGDGFKLGYNAEQVKLVVEFILSTGAKKIDFGFPNRPKTRAQFPLYFGGDNGAAGLVAPLRDEEDPDFDCPYLIINTHV